MPLVLLIELTYLLSDGPLSVPPAVGQLQINRPPSTSICMVGWRGKVMDKFKHFKFNLEAGGNIDKDFSMWVNCNLNLKFLEMNG